jgi:hypothetical protein
MESDELICERCGKIVDEVITRQGFIQTYFIEWVCENCYKKLKKDLSLKTPIDD